MSIWVWGNRQDPPTYTLSLPSLPITAAHQSQEGLPGESSELSGTTPLAQTSKILSLSPREPHTPLRNTRPTRKLTEHPLTYTTTSGNLQLHGESHSNRPLRRCIKVTGHWPRDYCGAELCQPPMGHLKHQPCLHRGELTNSNGGHS